MKTIKTLLIVCAALCLTTACNKNVDMTLTQKTMFEDANISQIHVDGGWMVEIIADTVNTFVELEYSAYLEDKVGVKMEGSELKIGFSSSVHPRMGSVYKATIHIPTLQILTAEGASELHCEGALSSIEDTVRIALREASLCSGLQLSGKFVVVTIKDDSQFLGCDINSINCKVLASKGSICNGSFNAMIHFVAALDDAQLVTFGGAAPYASIKLQDASLLNMVQTPVSELFVNLSGASEATVDASEQITGSLTEASTLFYKGNPQIDVDCSDDSQLTPF